MASKKQLAWRKKFAKMSKACKFRKKKGAKSNPHKKNTYVKNIGTGKITKDRGVKASRNEREILLGYGYTKAEIDAHFEMRKLEKKRIELRDRPEFNPDVRQERKKPDTGDW